MENTLENKAKFFAQYWGQLILMQKDGLGVKKCIQVYWEKTLGSRYLQLKPISQITGEDAYDVSKILYPKSENWSSSMWTSTNGEYFTESFNSFDELELFGIKYPFNKTLEVIDFLRSKSYALPYMGISVEQQIEWGWVNLKTNQL